MPPSIDEIPTASQLQQQLDSLNRAIVALEGGSPITNITVAPPTPSDTTMFVMPISLMLNPPINEQSTLSTLANALQIQADTVQQQLIDMGYAQPSGRYIAPPPGAGAGPRPVPGMAPPAMPAPPPGPPPAGMNPNPGEMIPQPPTYPAPGTTYPPPGEPGGGPLREGNGASESA